MLKTRKVQRETKHQQAKSSLALILGWATTPLFIVAALTTLCVWHPLIVAGRYLAPRSIHEQFIALGNRILLFCLQLTGARVSFVGQEHLPIAGPLIIVANHQSLFDIPMLVWSLRRLHAKFIAKSELGRGLPSASYVLRTNGHALIDRGDGAQASAAISAVARNAHATNGTVVIFAEGTRARDGVLKRFKPGGLTLLLREMPDAQIIPISINGAWRIMRHKFLPVPFGVSITCTVHPAIIQPVIDRTTTADIEGIIAECRRSIESCITS